MGLDFSAFLLNYLQRNFLKRSDIVGILVAFIAIFVSMVAMIVTQKEIPNYIVISSLLTIATGIVCIVIPYLLLNEKLKKNSEQVFKIEKIIIMNYDHINGRSDMNKSIILDKLKIVIENRFNESDMNELIKLLSIRYPV